MLIAINSMSWHLIPTKKCNYLGMDRGVPTDFSPQFARFANLMVFSQTFPSRVEPSDSHSGTWNWGTSSPVMCLPGWFIRFPKKRSAPKKSWTMKNCKRLIGAGEPKWGFKPLMLLSQVLPRIFDVHPPKKIWRG